MRNTSRCVRMADNIVHVQQTILNSPSKSTHYWKPGFLSQVHFDLTIKSHHIQIVQALCDAAKIVRVEAPQLFLNITNTPFCFVPFFSDEVIFHVSQKINKHNCVI